MKLVWYFCMQIKIRILTLRIHFSHFRLCGWNQQNVHENYKTLQHETWKELTFSSWRKKGIYVFNIVSIIHRFFLFYVLIFLCPSVSKWLNLNRICFAKLWKLVPLTYSINIKSNKCMYMNVKHIRHHN